MLLPLGILTWEDAGHGLLWGGGVNYWNGAEGAFQSTQGMLGLSCGRAWRQVGQAWANTVGLT